MTDRAIRLTRTAIVRVAAVLVFAWPLAGAAGTTDLNGTTWSVTGKARVAGVAHRNGSTRWFTFHDRTPLHITASFPSATNFTAHDDVGWDYSGTYARRGRRGANFRLTFDAASEVEFGDMLESWMSNIAEEQVSVEVRQAKPISMTVHGGRANVVLTRRFRADSVGETGRGIYTLRAKALRESQ